MLLVRAGRSGRARRERKPLPPGFGAIWTTVAIDLVGFGIVLPILPRYARDLSISPTTIGLIVGSFSLAQMVFSPIMGRLSDRFGRKPILIFSLCGTAVGSLLTGLAGPVWLLFVGRVVDGSSGASVSVAQAAVTDVADPADRPRLLGLLGAAFGVGFVLGPTIGSLAALGGPHVPFFVAAVIAGTNAVVALRRLPETHTRRNRPPIPAAIASSSGIRRLFAVPPNAARLILVAFVALFSFSGFESTFAELVDDRFHYSIASTGAIFTVIGLALVFVQAGLIHPVQAKLGAPGTMRFALVSLACGLTLLAVDGGWTSVVPALLLLVLGQGLLSPTLSAALAGEAGDEERGRLLGLQQSAGSFSRFVGPLVAGALYQHVGIASPYLLGAVVVILALLLVPPLAGGGAPERAVTAVAPPAV